MIQIYPVTETEYHTINYFVKINGQQAAVDSARVSAYPFNRRWPGHQRQIEQSELVNFISFACDGETVLEITPKEKFEHFVIRPRSLEFKSELTSDGTIRVFMTKPAYFTIEPFGRRNALHVFADPMRQYDLSDCESLLYFGRGVHEVGMLYLKNNQTVFIDKGAVVYGCIHAFEAKNIKILGFGILDNSHNREEILFDANEKNNITEVKNAKRTDTIQLEYCENIEIDGITIRDSLVYNIRPIACKNLSIRNVKIIGCWRYNSDGIDMHNCENVHILNCFLRTFDDSICIKGFDCYYEGDVEKAVEKAMYWNGKKYDFFRNVLVENCTIWNDWGKCLEIGAETRAKDISDIHFKNCNIIHVTHNVLSCCNVDYADVHDIVYENITVEYDDRIPEPLIQGSDEENYFGSDPNYAPALINAEVIFHPEYSAGGMRRGKIRNVTYRNIHLFSNQQPAIGLYGFDRKHLCKNIVIKDLYWNNQKINQVKFILFQQNEFCENVTFE